MVINWYGENCFRIQAGNLSILIDPLDKNTGLNVPRFKPDILIRTIESATELADDGDRNTVVIKGAGEYEVKDIKITGWQLHQESTSQFIKTVYDLNLEGIRIALLGHLSDVLPADIAGGLGGIDILFIPAGGKPFLAVAEAVKIVKSLAPRIVIPTFFKTRGLRRNAGEVKNFIDELGQSSENLEKLVVKRKDLADSKTKVVILKV